MKEIEKLCSTKQNGETDLIITLPPDEDLDEDGNYIGSDPEFLKSFNNMEKDDLKTESNNANMLSAVKFIEWVVELLPPFSEYDMDVRHRFSPQVKLPNENELLWIETHKYHRSNPKFYTTKEVYELWLRNSKMEAENLNKPQEQQRNCPDLTNVWYKILEEHADDIPTRDKFCDALWMLEAGGFCQLKFAL